MPFDDTSTREKTEIEILDEMAMILATPETWCKYIVERPLGDGQFSHCLLGALFMADHGTAYPRHEIDFHRGQNMSFRTMAAASIERAMNEKIRTNAAWRRSHISLVIFNNYPDTTHADILNFIAETRKVFETVEQSL